MSLLELSHITKTVALPDGQPLHILRDINLRVAAGEKITIVGRSGTGKSTLLNTIGMLDKPSSGCYLLDGKDTVRLAEKTRAALRGASFGFIFQQFNIFPSRTALENVAVPLLYATGKQFWQRRQIAAAMLERVGLGNRLDSYPGELSGGEQQRIAIARALVRRPQIILADEPTGALDPATAELVLQLLDEIVAEQQAALITITHDMGVAARAGTVYELADGMLHPRTRQQLVAATLPTPAAQQLSTTQHTPAAQIAPTTLSTPPQFVAPTAQEAAQ